jgi:uncharacterized peroxidase-related enzyme
MPRIAPVVSESVDSKVAAALSQLKASRGKLPNLFPTLAQAPVALDGFLSLSKALSRGRLSARQREILALAIAQENECQYCLSAHTEGAKAVGLSAADTLKARTGSSEDPFERALVAFTKNMFASAVSFQTRIWNLARKAGIDDSLILEIVAVVALNTLTNYTNRLADTEIDSPVVQVEL